MHQPKTKKHSSRISANKRISLALYQLFLAFSSATTKQNKNNSVKCSRFSILWLVSWGEEDTGALNLNNARKHKNGDTKERRWIRTKTEENVDGKELRWKKWFKAYILHNYCTRAVSFAETLDEYYSDKREKMHKYADEDSRVRRGGFKRNGLLLRVLHPTTISCRLQVVAYWTWAGGTSLLLFFIKSLCALSC